MATIAVIIPGRLDKTALDARISHLKRYLTPPDTFIPFTFQGAIRGIKTGADVSLLAPETVKLSVQAEKKGCDAVIIHGICDFGIEAARGAVDIPVVGLGSSVIHLACQLGDRYGVVSKSAATIPEFTRRIQLMGCSEKMTSIRPLNIPESALINQAQELKKRFLEIARYQIDHEGAHVIVAGYSAIFGVLPEGSREDMEDILGIPVLDGVAVVCKTAKMLIDLSLKQSRKAYPKMMA